MSEQAICPNPWMKMMPMSLLSLCSLHDSLITSLDNKFKLCTWCGDFRCM
jgi:hypothetical protein